MPKINKSRVINVRYNDDKRTIYNELFDFEKGKNVLFSMENGIGKTVLIQFLMQPFIKNGWYRILDKKPFQDYFNDNNPTVVMHEIKTEEDGEYLLIGMLIKLNRDADGKKKLKFLAFTHSYSDKNKYDIKNIPFIVAENGRNKIISFQDAEAMIKKAQKEVQSFKVYNLDDTSQNEEYFKILEEYRISYREWETQLRQINDEESGLSKLYEDSTTSEKLIRKNILPAIEEKVNDNKNILADLRESLKKYIEKYVGQKNILDKLQLFESFIVEAKKLTPDFQNYKIIYNEFKQTENTLIALNQYISSEINELQSDLTVYDELVIEAERDIEQIKIENISYDIHQKTNLLNKLIENMKLIEDQSAKLKEKQGKLKKNISIQKCAEEYSTLLEKIKRVTEVEERIANFEKDDNEILIKIKNYRFTLKQLYTEKISNLKGLVNEIENSIEVYKGTQIELKKQTDVLNNDKINVQVSINTNLVVIDDYVKVENTFIKSFTDFRLQKNLFGTYNVEDITLYQKNIFKEISEQINQSNKNKIKISELKKEVLTLQDEKLEAVTNKNELNIAKTSKEDELNRFNVDTDEINLILEKHEMPQDVLKNRTKLVEKIQNDIKKYRSERDIIQNGMFSLGKDLERIENCSLLDISDDFKELLNDNGIDVKQGLQRLKERKDSFEEKLELIKKNPFLPYSLLMSKDEMKTLSNLKLNTPMPIPIIDENNLNEPLEFTAVNSLYSVGSTNFYISFSEYLIDDTKRNEKIRQLKNRITIIKDDINKIDETINKLNLEADKVAEYKYKGNEGIIFETKIKELELKLISEENKYSAIINSLTNKSNELEKLSKELESLSIRISLLEKKSEKFAELKEKYEKYEKSKIENEEFNSKLKLLSIKEKDLSEESTIAKDNEMNSKINLNQVYAKKKSAENEAYRYENATHGIVVEGDIAKIEGALKACEDSFNSDLKRDKDTQTNLKLDIKRIGKTIDKEVERENLILEDYCNIQYSEELSNSLEKELDNIEVQINELTPLSLKNVADKAVVEDNLGKFYERLKLYGIEEAVPLAQIKNTDFKNRKREQEQKKEQYDDEVSDLNTQINLLKTNVFKLQKYDNMPLSEMNIEKLSISEIEPMIKEMLSVSNTERSSFENLSKSIKKELEMIDREYKDKHEVFNHHLSHLIREENPNKIEKGINLLIDILERQINAENTIRQNLEELRNSIINEIESYGYTIYEELITIDSNSTIPINNTKKKMLQINVPTKENLNKDGISAYIRGIIDTISSNETLKDIDVELATLINSEQLLAQLVGGLNVIKVKIYKIEKNGISLKDWEHINHKNSGGEKFVSVFIVFTALLSYVRKKPGDIQNHREGMIVIMDNPFAKTNAEHLLVPMFAIAEKYNVQLICFSGIGGSSVLNRFDVLYIAKAIKEKYSINEKLTFTNLNDESGDVEELELSSMVIEQQTLF